jgi:NADPH:quinone reductase-like Zn-dependent oxidoreductase
MGHEFTGVVVELGSDVKTVKEGDKIVSPFTTTWCVPTWSMQPGGQFEKDRTCEMKTLADPSRGDAVGNASIARTATPPAA